MQNVIWLSRGVQHLAGQFEHGLAEVGLLHNTLKSATLVVAVDGKKKRWFSDSKPYLYLNGQSVPSMTTGQAYK